MEATANPADRPVVPEALRTLVARGEPRRYRKGTLLIQEGEQGDTLYIVLTGRVKAFSVDQRDREIVCDDVTDKLCIPVRPDHRHRDDGDHWEMIGKRPIVCDHRTGPHGAQAVSPDRQPDMFDMAFTKVLYIAIQAWCETISHIR